MGTEEISTCQLSLPKQLTGIHTRIKVFTPGLIWEELLPRDKSEVEGNEGHSRLLHAHELLYMKHHDTNNATRRSHKSSLLT